jgi:O-antigen/teichoic acid export membrane protein
MSYYSKGHARRSIFQTAVFRVLSQAATMASYVVLVRSMTEQAFGILNLLYGIIPVISTVASLGIEQTLRRYQPEYLQGGNKVAAAWLLRVAARGRLVTNVLLLALIWLGWNWVAPIFQLAPYRAEYLLFCGLALLHFQAAILQLSLSSHMLQGYSVGMTVLLSVTKLIAYVLLAQSDALTLENAILADTVGYGLMYLGLRIAHFRLCPAPEQAGAYVPTRDERRRLVRYSLFNNFNDAGTLLLSSKSDNFFVAAMMNPLAVGTYSFYLRLNEMVSQLLPIRQFGNVIHPLFFAVPESEAGLRLPRYFTLLINVTMALQWPMLAYSIAYHEEIVRVLFAGKYLDSSWLLPLVVALATVNRVGDPATLVAQHQEKAGIILLSKIFTIYNVLAMLLLVPLLGVYGAALATGTAQLFKNLFIWWHVRGLARWLNFWPMLLAVLPVWGGSVLACFALKAALPGPDVAHLLAGAVICGAALLVHVRSAALAPSDRELLGSLMRGREAHLLRRLGVLRPG